MTSRFQVNSSSRILLCKLNNFFFNEFPKREENSCKKCFWFLFQSTDFSHLTPADFGDSLQNLIVIRINCGMNRPKPFFKGALALMNPSLRNKASVIFQQLKEKEKKNSWNLLIFVYFVNSVGNCFFNIFMFQLSIQVHQCALVFPMVSWISFHCL